MIENPYYTGGIERPGVYALLIKWQALEAHLKGWRSSPHYAEWSGLVRPFIAGTPTDWHYAPCIEPFHG